MLSLNLLHHDSGPKSLAHRASVDLVSVMVWKVQLASTWYMPESERKWESLSHVRLFVAPWTIQSMEFSRPEYWSGSPFPSPGDLPNPGIKPRSPALQADSLPAEPQGKPKNTGVVAYLFSSRSSRPRNRTGVSCIAGGFFTNWATGKPNMCQELCQTLIIHELI